MSKRTAKIQRDTKETQISCEVNIDGIGEVRDRNRNRFFRPHA